MEDVLFAAVAVDMIFDTRSIPESFDSLLWLVFRKLLLLLVLLTV